MVSAQVTSDGTVNTQVTTDGNVDEITGGETRGDNLFHSFQDFSVPTNNEAFFNNASDIANIFSRVTGGNISNINGLIRANGSANLFLVNPNGILFGENASLDIGGSFYGSTSGSILFEDGEFSATDKESPPLLTINAPIGLNLRDEPAEIINRSRVQNNNAEEIIGLEVSPGNNLTLVGGEINLEGGNLTAKGGRIELGGLSQAGTVTFNGDGSLSFPTDVARADVTLSNGAVIDVKGTGGGDVAINARNLNLEAGELGESLIDAGISTESTDPGAQAGDIIVNVTDNLILDDSDIDNQVSFGAVGNSGNINITTGSIEAINGGRVDATTRGQGNAGGVEIITTGDLSFDGENSEGFASGIFSQVNPAAVGNAGGVRIETNNFTLTNGGRVSASGGERGNPGGVEIIATGDLSFDGENSEGNASGVFSLISDGDVASRAVRGAMGSAGGVRIETNNLTLTKGGRVDASTRGSGNAGGVEIIATGDLNFDGEDSERLTSGVFSRAVQDAMGNAGGVRIETNNLTLTNGGQVNASVEAQGDTGLVEIIATGDLSFDGENSEGFDSGVFSQVTPGGVGNAVGVRIETNNLTLTNDGRVNANADGQGNAGSVIVEADSVSLDGENAIITSSTSSGTGGIVSLSVAETITLKNDSTISAEAFEEADGGNLSIDANFIIAFPSSGGGNDIIASAERGQGGNITINAESIFGIEERPLSATTNDINASSEVSGLDGTVDITTLDIDPIQGATELPSNLVVPEQTTAQACQSNREAAAQNGLNIKGKGGVPPAPELPLNSQNTTIEGEYTDSISATPPPIETSKGKIQPARGIKKTENGIILTAYPTNNQGDRLPEIKPNCKI